MLHFHPALLVVLWLQLTSFVRAITYSTHDSGCNFFFCMDISIGDDDMLTYEIKPIFEPFGWVGVGWGRQMKGTPMVVIWDDTDGSRILSQRFGVGHVEPIVDHKPPRVATLVEPSPNTVWETKSSDTSNYSTTAFQIPLNKSEPRPGTMIWAYSLSTPESDPNADLNGHYVAGTFNMRLINPSYVPPGSATAKTTLVHGIFLSFGFLVLLPAGVLVGRLGRTFTVRWFMIHRALNFYVALPVIALGWVMGPVTVHNANGAHLSDAHKICGVLLLLLYVAQLLLGRYIHAKHAVPGRALHPPNNILHVLLGLCVVALAFFQVNSGLGEWAKSTGRKDVDKWYRDVWLVWVLALPAFYFSGLALLKRQFFLEGLGNGMDEKNYIQLSTTAALDAEQDSEYGELESGMPLLARTGY
uniref:Cytochrome b561 domain-containing protein n=1 Tax=Mycena chlorophos TaxID=658473 RepID=A0ABQ0MD00_MYCCL|nr:predicted protein [Mycena chlorophos]